MLEKVNNIIGSFDGLEVSLKVGKESELTIKGDFIKILEAAAKMASYQGEKADLEYEQHELERRLAKVEA